MEDDLENSTSEHLLHSEGNYNISSENFIQTKNEMDERSERNSRLSFSSSFSALQVHPTNSAYLTTFLLLNTMIGSGILNQPHVFKESGILGGIVGFIIAAWGTWMALVVLTEVGIHEGVLEYSSLAKRAFQQNGERVVDIAIIILAFGAMLGYILIVGTTFSGLLVSWGCPSDVCNDMNTTIVSVACFVLPICLFRHFGHLAWLSIFSVATIVAVLFLVIIGGPIKHEIEGLPNDYAVFNISGLLRSTGSIIFSLSCASANFQAFISTEKKAQNLPTWTWVTGSAVNLGALMCGTMGLVGYLSFGSITDGMILDNFPQHGYDFFKLMVIIHLIMYIPVNFVIMRYSVVKITTGKRSELLPSGQHSVLTVFLLTVTVGTVLLLLSLGLASGVAFSLILDITGGIGGSMSTFLLPASIYLKLMPVDAKRRVHAMVLLGMGAFVMVAVVTETILNNI